MTWLPLAAVAKPPLILVVPGPLTMMPPAPGVPIVVFGPMTRVVPAAVLLLVMVRLFPAGYSRLPAAILARLIVCVPVTPAATVIAVTLLRLTPALEVRL